MLPKNNPTQLPAWEKISNDAERMKSTSIQSLFDDQGDRFDNFSIRWQEILFDFSKNLIDQATLDDLLELAEEAGLKQAMDSFFKGEKINERENRAVLHTALRNRSTSQLIVNGEDVRSKVNSALSKMEKFANQFCEGKLFGFTGKPLNSLVNIGIGGSDLGPVMVTEALKPYWKKGITPHFISNVDGAHAHEVLKSLDPETTLFIISSKTFTTQETMKNANTAKEWFLNNGGKEEDVEKHFVAVSTNEQGVKEFGINTENMFEFWEWVGGRYSLWSSIGLSIACTLGFDNFRQLLDGAHEMDMHFKESPFRKNIPVIMALIGLWYSNFFGADSEAVLPYDQYLHRFPAYLQQANMESNGKNIDRFGNPVNYNTGPVVWGEPGTNGQHAFYQLIHQGTQLIPCDFIASANGNHPLKDHHTLLLSNFFAQTRALMVGKPKEEALKELLDSGMEKNQAEKLAPFKAFTGNRPTNSIFIKRLNPKNLGALIAAYEHKIFVQGVIWNIFSFDQWGVELGKVLAKGILKVLNNEETANSLDGSTQGLLNIFQQFKDD